MERLGLGPDVFLGKDGLNDGLVYARLSGYVPRGSTSRIFDVYQVNVCNVQVPPQRYF